VAYPSFSLPFSLPKKTEYLQTIKGKVPTLPPLPPLSFPLFFKRTEEEGKGLVCRTASSFLPLFFFPSPFSPPSLKKGEKKIREELNFLSLLPSSSLSEDIMVLPWCHFFFPPFPSSFEQRSELARCVRANSLPSPLLFPSVLIGQIARRSNAPSFFPPPPPLFPERAR